MDFVRTAFFIKNIPAWERALRGLAGLALLLVAWTTFRSPWAWVGAALGAGFALTGVVGFCPLCALAGRRLKEER